MVRRVCNLTQTLVVLLPPADTLSLIDFGAAKEYPKRFVDDYLRMVRACADRNRDEVILRSTRMGFLTGEAGAGRVSRAHDHWHCTPSADDLGASPCLRQHGLLQVCELAMLPVPCSQALIVSQEQCVGEQPGDAGPQNPWNRQHFEGCAALGVPHRLHGWPQTLMPFSETQAIVLQSHGPACR